MNQSLRPFVILLIAASLPSATAEAATPLIPGTGTWIDYVGDPLEDPEWEFVFNGAKSSREQDEQVRMPQGFSKNNRWFEGPERGYPDFMKVIATPHGGLEGSKYALLVRSLHTGIPGVRSYDNQQDDLIVSCVNRLRTSIPVSELPSFVTRVYLPPASKWENRSGPHFGIRTTSSAETMKEVEVNGSGLFRRSYARKKMEKVRDPYWPGMWIHFASETSPKYKSDHAYIAVRGNRLGHDFKAKEIPNFDCWWTFGMSFTADGMVHYYASEGVDDLTQDDLLTSQYPYGYRALDFGNPFFNIVNRNDGKSWSTPFVIDDPRVYLVRADRVNKIVAQRVKREEQQATRKQQQQQARSRNRQPRNNNGRR